jgi:DNA-binding HxlR family transcriptional regulator
MYERKIPFNLECGLHLLREVLLGKWKIDLLYHIAHGIHRPSQLQKKLIGATRRVIQMQLKQMETHELVTKTVFHEVPLKVEYYLTPLGESLLPLIATMGRWGDEHKPQLQRVLTPVLAADNAG